MLAPFASIFLTFSMAVATSLGLRPKPLFALLFADEVGKQRVKEHAREPDGPRNPKNTAYSGEKARRRSISGSF